MPDITVTLTDAESKAMTWVAADTTEWVENAVQVRAAAAIEKITAILVAHCNANNITIATGEAAQIQQAFDLNLIETAVDRNNSESEV